MNTTNTYSGGMTVALCANTAKTGGFKFFGMENGGQCFVTNKMAYITPAADCNVPCFGDSTKQTMCGGTWKISYYEYVPLSEVPATTTGASSSATPTSTKPVTAAPTTTLVAGGSGTCAAVTVTQTASSTVTVTVTGGAAPASTSKMARKRRGAAGERGNNFQKYSFIKHIR
jgi:hypothetical protein